MSDVKISAAETDTFHLFGNIVQLRSPSSQNGSAFSLAECRTLPGAGAPPNRHVQDREAFYVLSGRYEFTLDGQIEVRGPGALVRVPDGKVHSFRNVGAENASMLIITWPGAGHDAFFSSLGEPLPSGSTIFPALGPPPDMSKLLETAKSCGIELLIPA